ncbi:hypothetical protein [Ktedonobacter sp. SOSP1-52]|nr:hypothetical protein [Ktedonobacter sp. SOSP1-52]
MMNDHNELTIKNGGKLAAIGDASAYDTSDPHHGKEGHVFSFDAATIQGAPKSLPLVLRLGVDCPSSECLHTVTFSFTVPFHAGRVLTPHQTVRVQGIALTLEKVVVTPSETRLYIRGLTPPTPPSAPGALPAQYTDWSYALKLTVGGQTYSGYRYPGSPNIFFSSLYPGADPTLQDGGGGEVPIFLNQDPNIVGISLFQPLFEKHGSWTLTVTKEVQHFHLEKDAHGTSSYITDGSKPSPDPSLAPWMFTFTLP